MQRKSAYSPTYKTILLAIIIVPILAVPVAMWQLWNHLAGWRDVLLLLGTYVPISMGVTIGLHRYFTHKSFEAVLPVKILLAILASLAIEGSIISWVADHRYHHQHSDEDDDIHSPTAGLFHAHMGWFFSGKDTDKHKYAPDLFKDPVIVFFDKTFLYWVVLSVVFPYFLGGWQAFLWGGLVRILVVHHVTWSINSICHVFGERPFKTTEHDRSTNLALIALPTMGESWHNTHHAFPTSARHGPAWWTDPSYSVIRFLQFIGLVRKVYLPSEAQFASRRIKRSP